MRWQRVVAWAAVLVAGLGAGCVPDDLPAYTPEGDAVMLITRTDGYRPTLGMVRLKDQHYQRFEAPAGGKLVVYRGPHHQARLINKDLWATFQFGETAEERKHVCYRLDRTTQTFDPPPAALKELDVAGAILVSHAGAPCWAIPGLQRGSAYTLCRREDLKPIGKLEWRAIAAGTGWWLRLTKRDLWELVDPQTRVATQITEEQMRRAAVFLPEEKQKPAPMLHLLYAQMSQDHATVGILFVNQSLYFAIFDAKTGNCLWSSGKGKFNSGTPLLTKDALWVLRTKALRSATTAPTATAPVASRGWDLELVRYVPGEPAANGVRNAQEEIVMTYPLGESYDGGYGLSPDAREFLTVVNPTTEEGSPRLLFVPISEKTKRSDVRVIELK